MKRRNIIIAIMLIASIVFATACSSGENQQLYKEDGMVLTLAREEVETGLNNDARDYYWKFAASLFNSSMAGGDDQDSEITNLLISPISVYYAMAMVANGSAGETRLELLDSLSRGIADGETKCGTTKTGKGDIYDEIQENLNTYLRAYLNALNYNRQDGEETRKEWYEDNKDVIVPLLNIANSIWMKMDPDLHVEEDFLDINRNYFDAGVNEVEFNDKALKTINKWIEDHTGGTIKDMLKQIPEDAIMYLINALSFEADWESPYEEYQVHEGTFYGRTKETQVDFMTNEEGTYLENENATGFIKPYWGGNYGFVALLPKEEVGIDGFIHNLTHEELRGLIEKRIYHDVIATMPKFETESSLSLKEAFKLMGVEKAFDSDQADFTKLGSYKDMNICIGEIYHNTYIKVHEKGTKAGAATVVEMLTEGAALEEEPPKYVTLDRPFLYMIMDLNANIPLFIGVMEDIE